MTKISAVLVGVVVLGGLGGCASRPSTASQQAENWRDAYNNYQRCLTRADTAHQEFLEFMEEFVRTHPGITLLQLGDLMQLKGIGELEGLTPKEKFILRMRIDNDNHRTEWCETSYASVTQMLRETDREIDSLRPRMLYVVP